jgi:hypothetical protein
VYILDVMKILNVLGGIAVVAVFAVTGCASGQTPTPSATRSVDRDKTLQFVKCLQEHGIPATLSGDGQVGIDQPRPVQPSGPVGTPPVDQAKRAAAEKACQQFNPLGDPPKVGTAEWDRMLQYAQCLRQHGLNVKDPQPGDYGVAEVDPNASMDKNQQAAKACEQYELSQKE